MVLVCFLRLFTFSKISFDNALLFLETEKDAANLNNSGKSLSSIKEKNFAKQVENSFEKSCQVVSRLSTEKSEKSDFIKKSSRKRTKNLLNMSLELLAPLLYPQVPEVDPKTGLSQLFSSIYCQNSIKKPQFSLEPCCNDKNQETGLETE